MVEVIYGSQLEKSYLKARLSWDVTIWEAQAEHACVFHLFIKFGDAL